MKHEFVRYIRDNTSGDRILCYEWENAVKFQMAEAVSRIMLTSLRSKAIGRGMGSNFMSWFTEAADRYGVDISVLVNANDERFQIRLEEWYGRFGFEEIKPGKGYSRIRIARGLVGPEGENSNTLIDALEGWQSQLTHFDLNDLKCAHVPPRA